MIVVNSLGSNRTLTEYLTQGGVAVDLTDALAEIHIRCALGLTAVTTATVVGDPTIGEVSYTLTPADIGVAGIYQYAWHVTLPNQTVIILPETGPNAMRVLDTI